MWRRILALFRPHVKASVLIGASIAVASLLGLANPLIVRRIIDDALPHRDMHLLALLALLMISVTLVGGAVDTLQTWLTIRAGQRVMMDLRVGLYAHLQKMSLRFYTDTRAGEILSRVTSDVSGVQEAVTSTATQVFQDVISTVSVLALMIALDARLTAASLLVLPLFVWPTRRAGTIRRGLSKEVQSKVADLTHILEETLSVSGALLTKTFGRQAREMGRFDAANRTLMKLELRRSMIAQLFWVTLQAFWSVAPAIIYWVGGRRVALGEMSLGSVVAFVALQNKLFFPLGRLFGVQVQIQGALALFERIFQFLDLPVEIADRPGAPPLTVTQGEVAFDDVQFSYTTPSGVARTTLDEVSFVARPGELTALVGPSGAGKSTITYLIPRLYDVQGGSVRIDGQDVRDVQQSSLGEVIGVVTQETFLFHATVRENLSYARPEASDEELIAAARAAQIHDRIMLLPEGYDTVVGERGYRLSGGERQRLAIARVLLKRAPIVLLDEATSALDTTSERLVQAALIPLMAGRTTIAIAHRLSTVLRADQILVVDKGHIVERGTHSELYRLGGLYTKLVDEQLVTTERPMPFSPIGQKVLN